MKNLITILALLAVGFSKSQVLIGRDTPSNSSVLIEFEAKPLNKKGILLEPVADVTTITAAPGTLAFDFATASLRYTEDGITWSEAITGGDVAGLDNPSDYGVAGQMIIGNNNINEPGAFVLSSSNKALVLPVVDRPELSIGAPPVGLMVYDSASKTLKVFNGNEWTAF